jgi:hypothetical protein
MVELAAGIHLMNNLLFIGSAFAVAGVLIYCLERWKVPLEAWRHKHFGTSEKYKNWPRR